MPRTPARVTQADIARALRAELAAVTEERDRMRILLARLYDAAGPLDADKMPADDFAQIITIVLDARAQLHSEIVSHTDMQKAYETERDVLREQLESLRAVNEKLMAALKPFADAASTDDYLDDIEIAETDTARKITFGHLRRARIALEGESKSEQKEF